MKFNERIKNALGYLNLYSDENYKYIISRLEDTNQSNDELVKQVNYLVSEYEDNRVNNEILEVFQNKKIKDYSIKKKFDEESYNKVVNIIKENDEEKKKPSHVEHKLTEEEEMFKKFAINSVYEKNEKREFKKVNFISEKFLTREAIFLCIAILAAMLDPAAADMGVVHSSSPIVIALQSEILLNGGNIIFDKLFNGQLKHKKNYEYEDYDESRHL